MNTDPHEKKTDSQIRKQLKAMAAADTPALKPAVSRAGYELTPVPEKRLRAPPVPSKLRRPRRHAWPWPPASSASPFCCGRAD